MTAETPAVICRFDARDVRTREIRVNPRMNIARISQLGRPGRGAIRAAGTAELAAAYCFVSSATLRSRTIRSRQLAPIGREPDLVCDCELLTGGGRRSVEAKTLMRTRESYSKTKKNIRVRKAEIHESWGLDVTVKTFLGDGQTAGRVIAPPNSAKFQLRA